MRYILCIQSKQYPLVVHTYPCHICIYGICCPYVVITLPSLYHVYPLFINVHVYPIITYHFVIRGESLSLPEMPLAFKQRSSKRNWAARNLLESLQHVVAIHYSKCVRLYNAHQNDYCLHIYEYRIHLEFIYCISVYQWILEL